MKAILRTYTSENSYYDVLREIGDHHDFSKGPYEDTVGFAVGSNQAILPVDRLHVKPQDILDRMALRSLLEGEQRDPLDEVTWQAYLAAETWMKSFTTVLRLLERCSAGNDCRDEARIFLEQPHIALFIR